MEGTGVFHSSKPASGVTWLLRNVSLRRHGEGCPGWGASLPWSPADRSWDPLPGALWGGQLNGDSQAEPGGPRDLTPFLSGGSPPGSPLVCRVFGHIWLVVDGEQDRASVLPDVLDLRLGRRPLKLKAEGLAIFVSSVPGLCACKGRGLYSFITFLHYNSYHRRGGRGGCLGGSVS